MAAEQRLESAEKLLGPPAEIVLDWPGDTVSGDAGTALLIAGDELALDARGPEAGCAGEGGEVGTAVGGGWNRSGPEAVDIEPGCGMLGVPIVSGEPEPAAGAAAGDCALPDSGWAVPVL